MAHVTMNMDEANALTVRFSAALEARAPIGSPALPGKDGLMTVVVRAQLYRTKWDEIGNPMTLRVWLPGSPAADITMDTACTRCPCNWGRHTPSGTCGGCLSCPGFETVSADTGVAGAGL